MQYVCNDGHEHSKAYNQQEKMKLHVILSKFHIGHDQIGATVQQLRAKQEITTICQNQPHSIFYTPQLRATQLKYNQPRHDTKEGKKHYYKQLTTTSMAARNTSKKGTKWLPTHYFRLSENYTS